MLVDASKIELNKNGTYQQDAPDADITKVKANLCFLAQDDMAQCLEMLNKCSEMQDFIDMPKHFMDSEPDMNKCSAHETVLKERVGKLQRKSNALLDKHRQIMFASSKLFAHHYQAAAME